MENTINFAEPVISSKTIIDIKKVIDSKILVHGPYSKRFEFDFNKFTNSKYSTSVSSCTAGMHLFYFYNNIRKGDEVILPAQTHTATAHAIELVGAKPIFIDSELETGNIDISKIKEKITKKTKAIAVVHFLGIPVNMQEILKIAKKYNLLVLEDCALSLGATYNGKHTGLFGDCGSFSFYPVKHITTGEGGMLISKNKKIIKECNLIKAFGIDKNHSQRKEITNYDAVKLGFNYRLSEINSIIGINQLKYLGKFLKIRLRNFNLYERFFKNIDQFFFLSSNDAKAVSSNYCFTIVISKNFRKKFNRDRLILYLKKNKINTSIYYPKPVPNMSYYKSKYNFKNKQFLNASYISENSISLPVGPHITYKNIKYINSIILKFIQNET
jgi:perosamine synthetase